MKAAATVSVHIIRVLVFGASSRGLAPPEVCKHFGLSPDTLADDEARVPAAVAVAMWTKLPLMCGDENFGLHVGEQNPVSPHPVLGYAQRHAATFGDALRCFSRFQRILQNVIQTEVTRDRDKRSLAVVPSPGVGVLPRHGVEFGFASTVALGQKLTGRDVRPASVKVRHAAPADVSEHVRIFGPCVRFGEPRDVIEFDAATFDLALPTADPLLRAVLEAYAKDLAAKLPETANFAGRVRRVLHDALHGGDPGIATVARAFRMSRRTLQRRLDQEGTSYQRVLEGERERLARHYLADSKLTIQEVAFMLGFADQAAFHRAFMRWTGKTPGHFRAKRGLAQ